jgi:hypothetical protein
MNAIEKLMEVCVRDSSAACTANHEDLKAIFAECRINSDEEVPEWFHWMLDMVLYGQAGKRYFSRLNTQMYSLLAELAEKLAWKVDDYGEGIEIWFFQDRIHVFISNQANDGKSCSSCEIKVNR